MSKIAAIVEDEEEEEKGGENLLVYEFTDASKETFA